MKRMILALLTLVLLAGFTACASSPKQKTVILDDKGAANGIPTPDWVIAYITGGNRVVEEISRYSKEHCFVVNFDDPSRDSAVGWVQNASGPAMVAQMVSTTVTADATAAQSGAKSEEVTAAFDFVAKAMSDASYTGLRQMDNWWQIVRNTDTKVEECRAFALYTVEKKAFDAQVAGILQNIIDNNKALSEAARTIYLRLIEGIHLNGFNQ